MSSSAAMDSPCPGPTATATRPSTAILRSASSAPRAPMAPDRTSMTSGAASIRASRGNDPPSLAASGDLPGPLQILVVVDLYPVHDADRRGEHRAAAPGELSEPVFVVQAGIAPPGGFERAGEPGRGRGLDQRH